MSNIDQQIKYLEGKSDEELMAIIGNYSIDHQPTETMEKVVFQGGWSFSNIVDLGSEFLKKHEPTIKEAVCGNDGILENIDSAGVKDVLNIVLPLFGVAAGFSIPIAIIAVCTIVVRAGIRNYCKDYIK